MRPGFHPKRTAQLQPIFLARVGSLQMQGQQRKRQRMGWGQCEAHGSEPQKVPCAALGQRFGSDSSHTNSHLPTWIQISSSFLLPPGLRTLETQGPKAQFGFHGVLWILSMPWGIFELVHIKAGRGKTSSNQNQLASEICQVLGLFAAWNFDLGDQLHCGVCESQIWSGDWGWEMVWIETLGYWMIWGLSFPWTLQTKSRKYNKQATWKPQTWTHVVLQAWESWSRSGHQQRTLWGLPSRLQVDITLSI